MVHSDDDIKVEEKAQRGHFPVLLREAVSVIAPVDGKTYLDCTFGGGGHTSAILDAADCRVVAIDRDPQAEIRARALKVKYGDRFEFHALNFSHLDKLQTGGYAGILFDFGVSSFQLDDANRGFSFMREGPLDMRMNPDEGISALQYVNSESEGELAETIRELGEEPKAKRIARAIVEARKSGEIATTSRLAEIVAAAAPSHTRIHPATKTFQAIRIAVNDELGEISNALPKAFDALEQDGVLAAISFHSLEDRIVKRFFKKAAGRPEDRFDHGSVQDRIKLAELLTRKPVLPAKDELEQNPRSRSAKLRAIRKD